MWYMYIPWKFASFHIQYTSLATLQRFSDNRLAADLIQVVNRVLRADPYPLDTFQEEWWLLTRSSRATESQRR